MTKRHKDQLEAKPKDVKKEEEAKTKEKDEDSEEILIGKRKSSSMAISSSKIKNDFEIKESTESENNKERPSRTTKKPESGAVAGAACKSLPSSSSTEALQLSYSSS